jgi:pimeloyl-ACP methyl ester carboxylesterase
VPVSHKVVPTRFADIAIFETSGEGLPLLMIHGNSGCKEVFVKQVESPLASQYRLIGMDLPGHGKSSDAFEPMVAYTMPGYARAAMEVLDALGIHKAAVLGWSLGGHAGLEMLQLHPGIVGLMITGTPPVAQGAEAIYAGFNPHPDLPLAGKKDFTPEDVKSFARTILGAAGTPFFEEMIARTDGRAREIMFGSLFTGGVSDQKKIAETSTVPLAVVHGADEPFVNTAYVGGLAYKALWDHHCYLLRGVGHAPFIQAPEMFNPILGRFMADMQARATQRVAGRRSRTAA